MLDARRKAEWARASGVMWAVAEANRNSKARPTPYRPADFDPTVKRPVIEGDIGDIVAGW